MSRVVYEVLTVVVVAGIMWGIRGMSSPRTAVRGNILGASCVLAGVVLTLWANGLLGDWLLWASMAAGAAVGWWIAVRTVLLKIPQLVGLLNGLGGGASALAGFVVLTTITDSSRVSERVTAALALAVGTVTFSGSAVAAGKLDRRIPQRPIVLHGHNQLAAALGIAVGALVVATSVQRVVATSAISAATGVLGLALGVVVSLRVGGADMSITISLLNSLSGVAGALAGFAVRDPILVAAGGTVGAAGLILTSIMCGAANRSLLRILLGQDSIAAVVVPPGQVLSPGRESPTGLGMGAALSAKPISGGESGSCERCGAEGSAPLSVAADAEAVRSGTGIASMRSRETLGSSLDESAGRGPGISAEQAMRAEETAREEKRVHTLSRIAGILRKASSVVVVPGYGMALAEAQRAVKRLMDVLEALGKDVRCAVHPLAGRMPGHMHVLLAEAEVPYEKLFDMDKINDRFCDVDAVVIVGANDVVNPAASTAVKTPIYGMPVLRVSEARAVIVLNQDTQPGYSGVPNTLYLAPNAILYLGDAARTVREIAEALSGESEGS